MRNDRDSGILQRCVNGVPLFSKSQGTDVTATDFSELPDLGLNMVWIRLRRLAPSGAIETRRDPAFLPAVSATDIRPDAVG